MEGREKSRDKAGSVSWDHHAQVVEGSGVWLMTQLPNGSSGQGNGVVWGVAPVRRLVELPGERK